MTTTSADFAFLARIAEAAGDVILPHFRTPLAVENKAGEGLYDPVTEADKAAELRIRALIAEAHPGDGILGEEFGAERLDAERVWIIDPIDGTRAFVSGVPLWGTLVGRVDNGRPALGLMAQPYIGEVFVGDGRHAEIRRGADVRPLRTRPAASLAHAVLMTTSPALFTGDDVAAFERVKARARLTRYGGDCYAYCMLAAGFVDLVVEAGLQTYDIAPLIPIVEGAGGVVTSWEGGSAKDGGRVVAAASRALLDEALELLAGRG